MDQDQASAPSPPSDSGPPSPGVPKRRRGFRWLVTLAVTTAVVAASLLLAVRFGPQLIARQVVRTYLDGLNIDTSGVDTIRIRPLQGYLSFGPVTFRGADATKGQVGRIGVNVDITRLLRRQALVQAIVIEGVRFEVRQAADGVLSLNGIPLTEILADAAGSTAAPPAERAPSPSRPFTPRTLQDELGWGAGLDLLEIRDSRIAFIDARGGEAVMHVHELELGGFRTWAPDKPGHYRLDAELNDIQLTASGIAKPFADKIDIDAKAAVTGIEVAKLERFIGELGFTSRAGQVDLAVQQAAVAVFTAGRVEARLAATGTMTGVDLAHPLFGSGRLATGRLHLDNISGDYDASGEVNVSGDLGIDLQASQLRLDNGTEVGFAHVAFALPGTTVKTVPNQQPAVNVAPQLDIRELRLGGPDIRGRVGNAVIRLSGFNIEGTEPGAPFLATGSVAVKDIDLQLPEAEPIAIAADSVRVALTETRLAFPPDRGPTIQGGLALDTRQLRLSLQQAAAADRPAPPPTRIEAARLAFELPVLTFDDDPAAGTTIRASQPLLSLDALSLGGPDVRGSVGRAALRLSSFGMVGTEPGSPLVATGAVEIDRLDLLLADAQPVAIATRALRADLAETRFSLSPGQARIEGGLALDTTEFAVSIQEQAARGQPTPPPTRIEAARLGIKVPKVAVDEAATAGAKVNAGGPQVTLDRLRLGGPDIQGTIGSADIELTGVDVETGQPGAPFIANGTLKARRLDLLIPDIEPIGIVAQEFDAALESLRFAFPSGRVLIEGGVDLNTRQLAVSIYTQAKAGKPAPPPVRILANRFAGKVPTLTVDDSRATGTKVKVGTPLLTLDQFRLDAPSQGGDTLRLGSSALTLRGVDVDVIDADQLEVSGRAGIVAPDLSVTMAPAGGAEAIPDAQIRGVDLDVRRFSYSEAADTSGFGLNGLIELESLQGRLPRDGPGQPSGLVGLSGLRLDVADLDFAMGADAPAWRARLDLDIGSLAATLQRPLSLIATIGDVSLSRFDGASPSTFMLDALTIGRIDASVIREGPAKPPAPKAPEPAGGIPKASRPWPPDDLPTVKVGRFALANGAQVSLLDETVAPPVIARIDIDALNLDHLDTTDADARTDLRLKARLGDGSISVAGWAEAFRAKPNVELQARIDALPLPTLSPYFAPQIGLDILSGHLTAGADAVIASGQLDGKVRARIVGVRASDRPKAGTDRISREIGSPLSTMIRLLEDRDGAIDIAIPVSGDILSPEFHYGGVIWGLLPRVLRALITSPVTFISAAASLISASRELTAATSDGKGAAAEATGLAPIVFAPGSPEVDAAAQGAILGLRQVLADRPKIQLRLCGVATPSDGTALGLPGLAATPEAEAKARASLVELARDRMSAVQAGLLAAPGVDRGRLPLCAEPLIAGVESGPPRVEIRF